MEVRPRMVLLSLSLHGAEWRMKNHRGFHSAERTVSSKNLCHKGKHFWEDMRIFTTGRQFKYCGDEEPRCYHINTAGKHHAA